MGQLHGLVARRLQVFVQHAADAFFDHIDRTRHRECGHGKTAGHRFDHHHPKRVRKAGEHKAVAAGVGPGEVSAMPVSRKDHVGVFSLQRFAIRTIAHQDFGAREIELQKRIEVFLHRQPSRVQEHRSGAEVFSFLLGVHPERLMVHAAGPHVDVLEAAGHQLFADGGGGHQGGTGGAVEFLQQAVAHTQGQFGVRLGVFGKFGVVGRGERHLVTHAPTAGRNPDGALGGNVHGVRLQRVQPSVDGRERPRGQANFGVAGQGPRATKIGRAEHFGLIATRFQHPQDRLPGAHHPRDLRSPSVGGQHDG